MRIDCERCPYREGRERCEDCLVEFVLELEAEQAAESGGDVDEAEAGPSELVFDGEEARAIGSLRRAGLIELSPSPRSSGTAGSSPEGSSAGAGRGGPRRRRAG